MSALNKPLLGPGQRDGPNVLPALQKLLQFAYSDDPDKQLEAVMGISKMIQRGKLVTSSSFGPLCHTLSRLAASEQRAVVAYAVRGIKMLVLDDALRPQATVAGIPAVLTATLRDWEDDAPCLREVLGALQTLCCDSAAVLAVVSAGALGPLLEMLHSADLELKILATATAANVLSFSDSLLLTNEECIDAFSDYMEDLLAAIRSREGPVRDYALAAVANACAHPVLAGRAKELGAPQLLGNFLARSTDLRVGRLQRAQTAIARLNGVGFGVGDVEEGGDAAHGRLQFYTFKWGVNPSVHLRFSPRHRGMALLGCVLVWLGIGFVTLIPVLGGGVRV